jgi:pimeloyl-ACP methyl ester carboxylesterase
MKKPPLTNFVQPLNLGGMSGRMLHMPAPKGKSRHIVLVYGHHASLERMFGLAEELNQYGSVTMPDLPGFGGMDSFYKINKKPTLDNLANYLAEFIEKNVKRQKLTVMGMSFGFLIVTRMLQLHPELTSRIDFVVSIVGFANKKDFKFKRQNYLLLSTMARVFSRRLPAWMMQSIILRDPFIRTTYTLVAGKHSKLKDAGDDERRKRIDFEIGLWQTNDVRTRMETATTMFSVDLASESIDLPVYHVAVLNDRYFDNDTVAKHLRLIYKKVYVSSTKVSGHVPTVIADAKTMAAFLPARIRKLLDQ